MSKQIQEKIDQLRAEIANMEHQKKIGISLQAEEQINRDIEDKQKHITELEEQINADEKATIEQEHAARVLTIANQFDEYLEKMDLGGMTLRQVIGGVSEYQLVTIELKKAFTAQADKFSEQISEMQMLHNEQIRAAQEREIQYQRQNDILQGRVSKQQAELDEANRMLSQEKLERKHAEESRDSAAAQLDESRVEIGRLNSHIDDLRKDIAVGASGAIKVIDTAEEDRQKKELADKIRKERTIYNVEWVDPIKQNRKKAKLAVNGETIEYPWTEQTKYFVIDESEVSQFREQYAIQPNIEVPSVGQESVSSDASVGSQFPTTPNIPVVTGPGVDQSAPGVQGEGIPAAIKEYVDRKIDQLRLEITGESAA